MASIWLLAARTNQVHPASKAVEGGVRAVQDGTDIYDVAISFAARDPAAASMADELAERLRARRLQVFYFRNIEEAARNLGERLEQILPAVYRDRARVVVLVISTAYGETPWTKRELAAALSRPNDDAGRPRIVPVHAEAVPPPSTLPADLIHPDTTDLGRIVHLLCLRCGRRGEGVRATAAGIAALASIAVLSVLRVFPGMPKEGWLLWAAVTSSGLGLAWAVMSTLPPALIMWRRRRRLRERLVVASEGPALMRFRRAAAAVGTTWAVAGVAVAFGLGLQVAAARLAARDVRVLLEAGHVGQAAERVQVNRQALADLALPLVAEIEAALLKQLEDGKWREFAPAYASVVRATQKQYPALEAAYLDRSGVLQMKAGDSVTALIDSAEVLRADAHALGQRLVSVAIARQLEYAMEGNDFYYGYEGKQAWMLYRQMVEPTRGGWLHTKARDSLPRNPGLSPNIRAHLLAQGDLPRLAAVLSDLRGNESPDDALQEIANSRLPSTVVSETSTALIERWTKLHDTSAAAPLGWTLARTMATLGDEEADNALVKAAVEPPTVQAGAHAVAVLPLLFDRADSARRAVIVNAVLSGAGSDVELLRMGAERALALRDLPAGFIELGRANVESLLRAPTVDDPILQATLTRLYRKLPGADATIVDAASERHPEQIAPSGFRTLIDRYEKLGPPPGSFDGAVVHAEMLRALGLIGDRGATMYLTGVLPSLAHGNMRIAAIESLWVLEGNLDQRSIAELDSLTRMASSRYRPEVLELFARQRKRLVQASPELRAIVLRIIEQTINVGENTDRGPALDLLTVIDPALARAQARSLAASANARDRFEGMRVLGTIWGVYSNRAIAPHCERGTVTCW